MGDEIKIGVVAKFFAKPSVAAIDLEADLNVGDTVRFKGSTTDFTQRVDSIQIEHNQVDKAGKGASIGVKVTSRVRPGDDVYKVTA